MAPPFTEVECVHRKDPGEPFNSKRLVVCCDGTWNSSNDVKEPPTNVSRLAGAFAHKCCTGMPQIVYYHPGAGTEASWTARQLGGIFGLGVVQDIIEVYRFICDNFNPGDEIVLIGFSRGAFTARSVAAMVCKLGYLNKAGMDQLPFIFSDYQNLGKWKEETYRKTKHLVGFTLENLQRVKRLEAWRKDKTKGANQQQIPTARANRQQIATELDNAKRRLFKNIKEMKDDPEHNMAAKAYQDMLAEHEMCMLSRGEEQDPPKKTPVKGGVRVVGVWETVGSLGFPRTSWSWNWKANREEKEICFASLELHPNIEYAFHALALDEWRPAFSPTLWEQQDNNPTKLRQVWFPGGHSNVGGGWKDQQIATIALAWMADQLTSVGIEFNKYEMQRIFYSVNPSASVRLWGLGKIYNPSFMTAWADRAYQYFAMPWRWIRGTSTDVPIRKPGMYEAEGERANEELLNTNELVHPCVRLRYQFHGRGLDDNVRHWACRALTENDYDLVSMDDPLPAVRERHVVGAYKPYRTLNSVLIPPESSDMLATGSTTTNNDDGVPTNLVKARHPIKDTDLQELPLPTKHWVWKRENTTLCEEQVGIWERMFMKINDKMLSYQSTQNGAPDTTRDPDAYRYRDIITWPVNRSLDSEGGLEGGPAGC